MSKLNNSGCKSCSEERDTAKQHVALPALAEAPELDAPEPVDLIAFALGGLFDGTRLMGTSAFSDSAMLSPPDANSLHREQGTKSDPQMATSDMSG